MQRISFFELISHCGEEDKEFLSTLGENGIYFFQQGNSYYALHDFAPGIVFVDFLTGNGLKALRNLREWLLSKGYKKAAFYCKEKGFTAKYATYAKAEIFETNFNYEDGQKAIACLVDLEGGRFCGKL